MLNNHGLFYRLIVLFHQIFLELFYQLFLYKYFYWLKPPVFHFDL